MTPVGHSLTGLAIFALAGPLPWLRRPASCLLRGAAFVFFANLPDLPVKGWGHDRYDISHSLFTTSLALIGCYLLYSLIQALQKGRRRWTLPRCVLVSLAIAWFSHILLDSFYNHGNGIHVTWPLGQGRLNLAMPWFETLRIPINPLSSHSLRIYAIESIFYGALLCIAISVRFGIVKWAGREKDS